MASDLVVPIVRLENVRTHPGADKLDICDVLGYQMVIPRGQHKSGDLAVYIPAETLVPSYWAEKWGILPHLKGSQKNRVGRVRLRGEPSFGLIVGTEWLSHGERAVGDNVALEFECKKYEPPAKIGCADMASYDADIDPFFAKYTDIQNGRLFTSVFQNDETVVATEKIHGRNNRVGVVGTTEVAGSHTTRKKRPADEDMKTNYDWFPYTLESIRSLLQDLKLRGAHAVVLYGEVFGPNVQSLDYGLTKGKLGYRAFDLSVDGKYVSHTDFQFLCKQFDVPTVPVLYEGQYSLAKIKEIADGKTTLGADHIREGTVVRPVQERTDPKIGRAILKFIGTEYELSKHKERDTTDV